jgi:hypothetical protein
VLDVRERAGSAHVVVSVMHSAVHFSLFPRLDHRCLCVPHPWGGGGGSSAAYRLVILG